MLALMLIMGALQNAPPAQPPFAETEALPGQVVTPAAWVTTPQPRFPREALQGPVRAGEVQLSCIVAVRGNFRSCEIIEETPPGYSFGREALSAVRTVRMTPRKIDGRPVETRVRFSVRFRRVND